MIDGDDIALFVPGERTLPVILARQAERYGERILLRAGAASWSYRETLAIAARSASRRRPSTP